MKVIWRARARQDLDDAIAYVAADSPKAAQIVFEWVVSATRSLADWPDKGRKGREPGLRELVVRRTPYIVIYRRLPGQVVLLRLVHGRRDR